MKKVFSALLIALLALAISASAALAANVVQSPQSLRVDGKTVECDKYNIDGSNYFKLRDIAYLLDGSGSQFSVDWDAAANAVSIVKGAVYTPDGSELDVNGGDKSSTAVVSSQTVTIDGKAVSGISVYNIGGNNYFKLRDLGSALGFGVDYDSAANTAIISSAQAQKALIKSVTVYTVDFETKEWVESEKTEYAYENGYPVTMTTTWPGSDESFVKTFAYTFANRVPVSLSRYDGETKEYDAEYVNGKLYQLSYAFSGVEGSRHLIYIYGNDDEYFTTVLHTSHIGVPGEPDEPSYNAEEIDEIIVTAAGGVLQKTVNHGLYTNWMDGEDRDWLRFNGTYTANYDKDGILTSTSTVFRDDQTPTDYLFETSRDNGRVTQVIRRSRPQGSDQITDEAKIVFEYTDIGVDAGRYSRMINAQIIEEGNSFYIYNWY